MIRQSIHALADYVELECTKMSPEILILHYDAVIYIVLTVLALTSP